MDKPGHPRPPDPAPARLERAMARWREVSSGEGDVLFQSEERCALTFEGGSNGFDILMIYSVITGSDHGSRLHL